MTKPGTPIKVVLAALGVIAAGVLMWIITISLAWKTGRWVGASTDIPVKAQVIAFTPSIVNAFAVIMFAVMAVSRKSWALAVASLTAFIMAAFLTLATIWFLAMGSIT